MFVLTQTWLLIMAAVVLLHWVLPPALRDGWIVAATAGFIGWYDWPSLVLLTVLTALFHIGAGREHRISGRRLAGLIALAGGLLVLFKIRAVYASGYDIDGGADFGEAFVIPLGLSYYTLRCIHYAVEKYKGVIPAHRAAETVQYLFFLPTLIAGPIHRFPAYQTDLRRKRWDAFLFAEGCERILYGYVKIMFFGNLLVGYVLNAQIMEIAGEHAALAAYLRLIHNGLLLYFLFAGYSDIAVGFARLLGFRVIENFNWPLLATNISAFWKRWHISLTGWCREYVYMGVIAVSRSPALASASAMVVMGLWHEVSLRYLAWGIYHGLGILAWQQWQKIKPAIALPAPLRPVAALLSCLLTLHFVFIGFDLVRHDSFTAFWDNMSMIFSGGSGHGAL